MVTREAPRSPVKPSQERMEGGVITYTQANTKKTIMYFLKDCEKPPRVGDNVRFDICQVSFWMELGHFRSLFCTLHAKGLFITTYNN